MLRHAMRAMETFMECMFKRKRSTVVLMILSRLDDLIPNTPMPRIRNPANANSMKRKAGFDSPMAAKVGKTGPNSGAANFKTPIKSDGARTHLQ